MSKVPPTSAADDQLREMLQERDAALLSLDERRLRAYFLKYNGKPAPSEPEVFWRAIHKARTACLSLPMEARIESKRWLIAHGSQPLDDGDVPI
jgi:hypothetical protein